MWYFNTESKWNSNSTRAYLGSLLLSNIIFSSIAIVGFVSQVVKAKLDARAENLKSTRVEDISHLRDMTRDNILNQSAILNVNQYGLHEEEKKADATGDTFNNTKQHINNISDSMEPRTWRPKIKASESMVNEIAQREMDKLPMSIKKIFQFQTSRK